VRISSVSPVRRWWWGWRIAIVVVAALVLVPLLGACATGPKARIPIMNIPKSITVSSTEFTDGGPLPVADTCTSGGAFPALTWTGIPHGTAAVAVIVYDLDGAKGIYVHRIVTDIDPAADGLPSAKTPTGAVEYATSTGAPGWTPPCPDQGSGVHRYVFWVLALDRLTRIPATAVTATAIATITEAAFAQGQIVGTVDAG